MHITERVQQKRFMRLCGRAKWRACTTMHCKYNCLFIIWHMYIVQALYGVHDDEELCVCVRENTSFIYKVIRWIVVVRLAAHCLDCKLIWGSIVRSWERERDSSCVAETHAANACDARVCVSVRIAKYIVVCSHPVKNCNISSMCETKLHPPWKKTFFSIYLHTYK